MLHIRFLQTNYNVIFLLFSRKLTACRHFIYILTSLTSKFLFSWSPTIPYISSAGNKGSSDGSIDTYSNGTKKFYTIKGIICPHYDLKTKQRTLVSLTVDLNLVLTNPIKMSLACPHLAKKSSFLNRRFLTY